jgi:hypothetical protein
VVGFDDFGAFGASLVAAAEEGDPDRSGAAEEAEEGEEGEAGDNADYDAGDGASGETVRVAGFSASEGDICTGGDGGEKRYSGCG